MAGRHHHRLGPTDRATQGEQRLSAALTFEGLNGVTIDLRHAVVDATGLYTGIELAGCTDVHLILPARVIGSECIAYVSGNSTGNKVDRGDEPEPCRLEPARVA